MNFSVCPRVKSAKSADGTFRFTALRVFTVGDGDRFVRALRAFLPTLPVQTVSRDDANVILSVASVFSSQNEYCAIRIRENRIAAAVKNADLIHDCDITRMGEITDDDGQRIAKYERALRVLARKEVFG